MPTRSFGVNTAARVTKDDLKIEERKFHRSTYVGLDTVSGDNIQTTWQLSDYLDRYTNLQKMTDVYDQYRYSLLEVWVKNSNINNPAGSTVSLVDEQATNIYSAIDLDTNTTPTYEDVFSYNDLRVGSITRNWQKVAVYCPRMKLSYDRELVLNPGAAWLDTSTRTTPHLGFIAAIANIGGAVNHGVTNTTIQRIQVYIRATIQFRGRRITT